MTVATPASRRLWASQALSDGGLGRLPGGQGGLEPGHGFSAREGRQARAGDECSWGPWLVAGSPRVPSYSYAECPCPLQFRLPSCLSRPLGRNRGSRDCGWASGHLHGGLGEPASLKSLWKALGLAVATQPDSCFDMSRGTCHVLSIMGCIHSFTLHSSLAQKRRHRELK